MLQFPVYWTQDTEKDLALFEDRKSSSTVKYDKE